MKAHEVFYLTNVEDSMLPNLSIYMGGHSRPWATIDKNEYQQFLDEVTEMNRLYIRESFLANCAAQYTKEAISNPCQRGWKACWQAGHAGWDCHPMAVTQEEVRSSGRDDRVVYVKAQSAALAIERAILMCIMRGKTYD